MKDASEFTVSSELDEDALGEGDADEIEGFDDLHGWNGLVGAGGASCGLVVVVGMRW